MSEIDKRVHTLNNVFDRLDSILGVLNGRRDETNREAIEVLETIIENASTASYQEALVRLDDEGLKEYYKNVIEFVLVLARKVGIPESMLMEGLRESNAQSVFFPRNEEYREEPQKYVDPTGMMTEATMNSQISSLKQGTTSVPLSALIDTTELANIIHNNNSSLDDGTRNFLSDKDAYHIADMLEDVTVHFGVNAQNADSILSQYGETFLDGLTLGNDIFMRDAKPSAMTDSMANLLGHEAIHSLQAAASGGVINFLGEYFTESGKHGYTAANKFELAGYKFGGSLNVHSSFSAGISQQIFKRNNNWWK